MMLKTKEDFFYMFFLAFCAGFGYWLGTGNVLWSFYAVGGFCVGYVLGSVLINVITWFLPLRWRENKKK